MTTDELTTKDVIKLLPVKGEMKLKLLRMYDYMEPNQQLIVARLAWKMYYYVRNEMIDMNMELELAKIEHGDEQPGDKSVYQTVEAMTDQELLKQLSESAGTVELAGAREAMHQIVKEMRDSKADKKAQAAAQKN